MKNRCNTGRKFVILVLLGVFYLSFVLAFFSFASLTTPPGKPTDEHPNKTSKFDTRKLGFTAPHFFYKLQSDRGIRKTEDANFNGVKSNTQWWYFDCVLEDGSLLVIMFSPMQWWSETDAMPTHKAIVYVSYLPAGGAAVTATKSFDAGDVRYTDSTLSCPVFSLERLYHNNTRRYNLKFELDSLRGAITLTSTTKAFSPFPGGVVGKLVAKHLLKLGGDEPVFRYAAHVPHGYAQCDVNIHGKHVMQNGTAYHEQGMFRGTPDQLGKGWAWVHFVSKHFNVFGKPQDFVCLEKNGKKVISGTTFFDRGMVLSNTTYANAQRSLLTGGSLSLSSDDVAFTVDAIAAATPLNVIPSAHTKQLWGTVAQPSVIRYTENGKTMEEVGVLLLETCKMGG